MFRTGGDEFLVIVQDHTSDELMEGIEEVKTHLAAIDVSVSMGLAYTQNYKGDFEHLERLADARMYEDKARYYESSGIERRG